MEARYQVFQYRASIEKLFQFDAWMMLYDAAAAYATKIGRERIINVTQLQTGAIIVWYWADIKEPWEEQRCIYV